MSRKHIFFIGFLFLHISVAAQVLQDVIILSDSNHYTLQKHTISFRQSPSLYFEVTKPNQAIELSFITNPNDSITNIQLLPSPGYMQLDSVINIANNRFLVDVKLTNIFEVAFPKILIKMFSRHRTVTQEVKLYPFIFPVFEDQNPQIEIFNNQEIEVPLPIQNVLMVKAPKHWQTEGILEYKLLKSNEGLSLLIKPNAIGLQSLTVGMESVKPYLDSLGVSSTALLNFRITVRVVRSKFNYLNFTESTYFFEPQGEKAITVWFDYNPNIKLNKTYRIEDQETPGGRLVAEVFTRAYVENQNKVIASMRTYALHQVEGGMLYVKEGDKNRFFTNFNILPKPFIEKVSILRPGKDWTESPIVYPGEEIELKVQGKGLASSLIRFADGKYPAQPDTIRKNNQVRFFTLSIPATIKERSVPISLNHNTTSFELLVNEYQRPRPLDFITINYGNGEHPLTSETFYKPALYHGEIGDIVITSHNDKIDSDDEFYGVQYVDVELRLWDKNNRQIELRNISNVKLVPDKSSIRHLSYNHENESAHVLRINDILVNKTYDLRPWSKVEITVQHHKERYGGQGYEAKAIIYRSDNFAVDIEVSFPAGLLVVPIGSSSEVSSLTGLSVASMANFTFYKKGKIKKEQPLRLGLGFIALNAINSIASSTDESDIGAVALASFQPLHSDSKINFPLYAGFGYLFKSENLFLLIGPGIKFTF